MVACWREMFRIAGEKDLRPENEFVPAVVGQLAQKGELAA